MSVGSTPLLFLHGYWHGSWRWSEVLTVLTYVTGAGRPAVAVDMAGHGLPARRPTCLTERPFSPEEPATEVSPAVDVDLDRAGELLVSLIEKVGRGGPVTVVAHSMGGTVLTRAAQLAPELVAHAVYLTAFMPASGMPAAAYLRLPENAGSVMGPAFDTAVADVALGLLATDAPVGIALGATTLTRDGWGSVPRTYITRAQDRAILPALQRKFIDDADTAFPANPTSVVALQTSHSPFLSMPREVADIVAELG
ncbi:alpha/beta fold hydrolase [Streptomyces sp. NPDC002577]